MIPPSLSKKALLVRMSIHSWYGKKIDRSASAAAAKSLGIEVGSDEYYKFLIPKKAFEPIKSLHFRLREMHNALTFPWYDDGLRVLPSVKYFQYTHFVHEYKDRLSDEVEIFLFNYETHKQYARANRTAVYNEDDYPDPDDLRRMFSIDVQFLPFPEASDFRITLDHDAIAQLRQGLIDEQQRVIQSNVNSLKAKIHDRLNRVALMCVPEARVYSGVLENLWTALDMADNLNLSDDPSLVALVAECNSKLRSITAEGLRTNPDYAFKVQKDLKSIMEQIHVEQPAVDRPDGEGESQPRPD